MSASSLLGSFSSHNLIAAHQITKFNNSIQKLLLCSDEPIEVQLTPNYFVISSQIVHLVLKFAIGFMYIVDFGLFLH